MVDSACGGAQIAAPQGAPVKSEPVHPNQLEDEQKGAPALPHRAARREGTALGRSAVIPRMFEADCLRLNSSAALPSIVPRTRPFCKDL